MENPIPESVLNLIERVCEPDPERSDRHREHSKGVTPEIALALQDLGEAEIVWLPKALTLYEQFPSDPTYSIQHDLHKSWAAQELCSHTGPRVIPFVVQELEATSNHSAKRSLITVLGNIGEPALGSLGNIFFKTEDLNLAIHVAGIFLAIGQPAAYLVALALEHPESAVASYVMHQIAYGKHGQSSVEIGLVHAIVDAIMDELVIRDPTRPNHFNDKTTAECLQTLIDRSPQVRKSIQARLCDIAFADDSEAHERAVQVGANLDVDGFMQNVRMRAYEHPDIAARVFYRLGIDTPTPSQRQSLTGYTERLENLEKRSLQRWDDMAHQSKIGFWLRSSLTVVYFVASLAVIGIGMWLLVTSDDAITRGIGSFVSALTTIGSMLTRFWKAPVEDIKGSFIQQAGIEATFIGFMTRIGQIRLLFEQNYAKGEIRIEELDTFQRMISDTQTQTIQELAIVRTTTSRLQQLESETAQSSPEAT